MQEHRFVRSAVVGWTLSLLSLWTAACGDPAEIAQSQRALTPDPARTVTIQVHGWNLSGSTKDSTVGDDRGGGDIVDGIRKFSSLPHGQTAPAAPNQIIATEYYGATFPSYYTAADEAEVKALKGIPRYALIVAKYARYVMQRSGADGINLTCHSMGCLISRYLIENDVGKLASEGRIKRWVSFAGVVNGAALADIDDGKLSDLAKLIGYIETGNDIIRSANALERQVGSTENENANHAERVEICTMIDTTGILQALRSGIEDRAQCSGPSPSSRIVGKYQIEVCQAGS